MFIAVRCVRTLTVNCRRNCNTKCLTVSSVIHHYFLHQLFLHNTSTLQNDAIKAEPSDTDKGNRFILHGTHQLYFEFPELELVVPYFVLYSSTPDRGETQRSGDILTDSHNGNHEVMIRIDRAPAPSQNSIGGRSCMICSATLHAYSEAGIPLWLPCIFRFSM